MPRSLEELIACERWFHAIDFGGQVRSPGRFQGDLPPNYTLFGVFECLDQLDIEGTRVVDVGTMDGLIAFILKARGAAEVIATDLAPRETFEAARARLGCDVDYRVPVMVTELPGLLGERRADLVVLAGVLYHVLDPIGTLVACRDSLRRGGFLIVETMYLFDEAEARVSFNPADSTARGVDRANVFWRPSKRALLGMLELTGFEVLGSVIVDGRIAVLAQARRPSEIDARGPFIASIHRSYGRYRNYRDNIDFDALERDDSEPSRARCHHRPGDLRIYPALYHPRVPYQPPWSAPDRTRLRHCARSAWFHARAVLADAGSAVSRWALTHRSRARGAHAP